MRLLLFRAAYGQSRADHADTHWIKARSLVARAGAGPDIVLHITPARAAKFNRPTRRGPAFFVQNTMPAHGRLMGAANAAAQCAGAA